MAINKEPFGMMNSEDIYIVMCEKARDIIPREKTIDSKNWSTSFIDGRWVEYPILSQSELQKIAGCSPPSQIHELHRFMESQYPQTKEDNEYGDASLAEGIFDTWDEIWLAFVIKTLYSKIWNGEEWK